MHIDGVHLGLKPYAAKGKRVPKCPFCDQNWAGDTTLSDHISKIHPDEPLPYICDKCTFKTFSKHNLARHINVVHNAKPDEFKCIH